MTSIQEGHLAMAYIPCLFSFSLINVNCLYFEKLWYTILKLLHRTTELIYYGYLLFTSFYLQVEWDLEIH